MDNSDTVAPSAEESDCLKLTTSNKSINFCMHMHWYTYVGLSVCMYVRTYVYMDVFMYVCMYVCMRMCTHSMYGFLHRMYAHHFHSVHTGSVT